MHQTIAQLRRQIDRLLAVVEPKITAFFELPKRIIQIDEETGSEQVLYETTLTPVQQKRIHYKEYVNLDEDGIDP